MVFVRPEVGGIEQNLAALSPRRSNTASELLWGKRVSLFR